MPSSIPYDPSLILGNIITREKLENIEKISDLNAPADAAETNLNSLITLKRSLDMTADEMRGMKIPAHDLEREIDEVEDAIEDAAKKYAEIKTESQKQIAGLNAKISMVNSAAESVIDYNKSELKAMPLGTNTLQMNCQYFSFDQNKETANTYAANISSFVSGSYESWGRSYSSEAKKSAQAQVHSQNSKHSIAGTLVVCVNCTHENARVFAPYILNPDKAISSWNATHPDDTIDIRYPWRNMNSNPDKKIELISGMTYGSSFVAMVHVLNTTKTSSQERMYSVAQSLQGSFEVGGWFSSITGGFGVESSFSSSAKNLLSTNNIQAHCTISTMGIIPTIKSNEIQTAVKTFSNLDGESSMNSLAKLQNAVAGSNDTIGSAAEAARTGQQMISLQNSKIETTLSALSEIDAVANKVIDVNSMMTALDDYIEKCSSADDTYFGVPLNYYLKPITKKEIIRAYANKYFPNKRNSLGSADDTEPKKSSEDTATE